MTNIAKTIKQLERVYYQINTRNEALRQVISEGKELLKLQPGYKPFPSDDDADDYQARLEYYWTTDEFADQADDVIDELITYIGEQLHEDYDYD